VDLSGRDDAVRAFLESVAEVGEYWDHVVGLIDGQVETYLTRGFTSLSVHFGCTGGQHRSVYFAERLAKHLRDRFPEAHLELAHREEKDWPRRGAPVSAEG
jgi:RNase adaptor protein for sRNA GlmZ degradation